MHFVEASVKYSVGIGAYLIQYLPRIMTHLLNAIELWLVHQMQSLLIANLEHMFCSCA